MEVTFQHQWVNHMAETLISEITKQMSGIDLRLNDTRPPDSLIEGMDAVYGHVDGDYRMVMQLRAEKRLFYRFAEKMIGDQPEDQNEVEEYAMEFFNVVCGRFVSELHVATGRAARFYPTVYEHPPNVRGVHQTGQVCSLHFLSEENEHAVFYWAAESLNPLVRRVTNG